MGHEKDIDSAPNSKQSGHCSPFISYDAFCGLEGNLLGALSHHTGSGDQLLSLKIIPLGASMITEKTRPQMFTLLE